MIKGEMQGYGLCIMHDGTEQLGFWKSGVLNGYGSARLTDGSKYIGEFKNDDMQGHGLFVNSTNEKYFGEFKNGSMQGHGLFINSIGEQSFGKFRKNKFIEQTANNKNNYKKREYIKSKSKKLSGLFNLFGKISLISRVALYQLIKNTKKR